MTHMPADAVNFVEPEFQLGSTAQTLHNRSTEYIRKRFPHGTVGSWEHVDNEGQTYGFKSDVKLITLRNAAELYLVIPFVQCQRGDLATALRLRDFYKSVTLEVNPLVLILTVMMTQEEVQMAKELNFEVISFLTDLPQEGAVASSPNQSAAKSRRQSVMWDSVFELAGSSKHLPEVKTWEDFFKLCKLPPEKVVAYAARFAEEALELEQLGDLDRNMLKEFDFPIGLQVRVLRLAARLIERAEARAIAASRNPLASNSTAVAPAVAPAAATAAPLLIPITSPPTSLPPPTYFSPNPTSSSVPPGSASPARSSSPSPYDAARRAETKLTVPSTPPPALPSGAQLPPQLSPQVSRVSTVSPMRPVKVAAVPLPPPPPVPSVPVRMSTVALPPPPPPLQIDATLPPPLAMPPPLSAHERERERGGM